MPPTDHLLTRRRVLALLGTLGAGAVVTACGGGNGSATASKSRASGTGPGATTSSTAIPSTTVAAASCVLTAEQEQGPYYYPAAKVRADITDGKPGVPMELVVSVVDIRDCSPVRDAAVDVWHADALGSYSDTSSGLFLRGIQTTGADGVAQFTSIYPGWYPGRTNHVHVKVHVGGNAATTYSGGHVSHTGNLFFPEDVSTTVAGLAPYTTNRASRVPLTSDFVYRGQQGSGSVMTLTPREAGNPSAGYRATMTVAIDPTATPALIGIAGTVS